MPRWLVLCLWVLAVIGVTTVAGPAWAVVSETNITAISTDGNRLPIKKITLKTTQGQTIATATPDQKSDDDDAGAAMVPVDLQRSGDEDQQQVVIVVEIVDPKDPSKTYTDEFTATVPVGGSADVRFAVNLANGAMIGTQTGRQTAMQIGRQAIGMRDPDFLLFGVTPVFGISHTQTFTQLPGADVGNFNWMAVDVNDEGFNRVGTTEFTVGLGPTFGGGSNGLSGLVLRGTFNITKGGSGFSTALNTEDFTDRTLFSVDEAEGDAALPAGMFKTERDFSTFGLGGRAKVGYAVPITEWLKVAPYIQAGFSSSTTTVETEYRNWTPAGTRFGFLDEEFESDVSEFGGGVKLPIMLGRGFSVLIDGHVRGVSTETKYTAHDCFSNVDDVACGADAVAFNQQGFERNDSTTSFTGGAGLSLGYSCGAAKFSLSGGFSYVPVAKVDYRNAATNVTDISVVLEPSYTVGASVSVDIAKAAYLLNY